MSAILTEALPLAAAGSRPEPAAPRGSSSALFRVTVVALALVAIVAAGAALRRDVTPAPRFPAAASTTALRPDPTAEAATAAAARAAAQRYADAWWTGDAATFWHGITAELQERYTVADIQQLLAEHPARPRIVAATADLTDPTTARITFTQVGGLLGGEQILLHDGRRWRWQVSP